MPTPAAAPAFVLFMATVLVAALQGLAASGHFPPQQRSRALQSGAGVLVLYGTIAIAAAAVAAAAATAWRAIPWPAAIIGGGATLLAAPMVLRLFPDRFVDGHSALLGFAGAAAVLALLMIWMTFAGGR